MHRYENWTKRKDEHRRIDGSELWCWSRLLRVPWTLRRSNLSILKEHNPEHSLEGLMLRLKLWYFDHMMPRANSLEKTLMLGKIESRRRRGQHRVRWLLGITDSVDKSEQTPGDGEGQERLPYNSTWVCKELDTTQQCNNNFRNSHWTRLQQEMCREKIYIYIYIYIYIWNIWN